jgi:UDP-N-acetylglucosamine:LPS N-acetylglucosamine transferase
LKRILILTADFGYGHRSAAKAIAGALEAAYGPDASVSIMNPLDDPRAPAYLRDNQAAYDRVVREAPELYLLSYTVSDTKVATGVLRSSWTLMMFNVLRDILRQQQPDLIVVTFHHFQAILGAIFELEGWRLPVVTVVTDLGDVKKLWFHPVADLCLVPTPIVQAQALEAGLPPQKVKVTGLPVRRDLAESGQDQAALRAELGWRADLFTILAIGSTRVNHLDEALRALNHSGWPLQLVVVAGGDHARFEQLQATQWHVPAHVYDYVTQMGAFMRAADSLLSKAGGLTVAESLAAGLPLILVDVIQGQETGNADYVVSGGAGVLVQSPLDVLETVSHWLANDRELYRQQAAQALKLGRPRAALDAADLIWNLASNVSPISYVNNTSIARRMHDSLSVPG